MTKYVVLLIVLLSVSACGGLAGEPRVVGTLPTPLPTTPANLPRIAPDLARGGAIFAERCVSCHGAGGRGDGALIGDGDGKIANRPPDFTDPATLRDYSPQAWYQVIRDGRLDKFMPPWGNALNNDDLWAVTFYTYTLQDQTADTTAGQALWQQLQNVTLPAITDMVTWTDALLVSQLAPDATLSADQQRAFAAYVRSQVLTTSVSSVSAGTPAPANAASVPGTVRGHVANGTPNMPVPANLTVTLIIFNEQFRPEERAVLLSTDNTFTFSDVPMRADYGYVVSVTYQGRRFASNFTHGGAGTLDLPITVYEITEDPASIRITGLTSQVNYIPNDRLEVLQIITYVNVSDRMYSTSDSFAAGVYGSVRYLIPAGATVMGTDDPQRYAMSTDFRELIDTTPLMPGESLTQQIVIAYPFTTDVTTVTQKLPYALEGEMMVMMAPTDAKFASAQLVSQGNRTIHGMTYQVFSSSLWIAPETDILFTAQPPAPALIPPNLVIPAALISAGIVMVLAAGVLFLKIRQESKA